MDLKKNISVILKKRKKKTYRWLETCHVLSPCHRCCCRRCCCCRCCSCHRHFNVLSGPKKDKQNEEKKKKTYQWLETCRVSSPCYRCCCCGCCCCHRRFDALSEPKKGKQNEKKKKKKKNEKKHTSGSRRDTSRAPATNAAVAAVAAIAVSTR